MNGRRHRKRSVSSFLALSLVLLLMVNLVMPGKAYAFPSVEELANEALEQTGMKDLVDDVASAVDTVSYKLNVSHGVSSTTVTTVAADVNARVQVNGQQVASGHPSAAIALKVGSNTITIVVTAQDGVTARTYTVTVNRAVAPSADRDDDDNDNDSGGTPALQPQPVQPLAATVSGLKIAATVDAATGTVKTELDANTLNKALEGTPTGDDGKKLWRLRCPSRLREATMWSFPQQPFQIRSLTST